MSDAFTITNPALSEANDELKTAVWLVGDILDRLNGVLARMGQATQNSAVPLWQDLQTNWNRAYHQMLIDLTGGHRASVNAHDWYLNGDLQAVRIMS
jgi:hypothetical protein